MTNFDPQSLSARCSICPLGPEGCLRDGHWTPVPTEYHDGDEGIAVVGHPSSDEEQAGHQFAGDQGGEWSAGLIAAGSHRTKFAITPTILCRPPGDEKGAHDRMVKTLDKMNKARAKEGKDLIPSPESCCRPRLFNEISRFERIICLGGKAFKAVCGESRSVTKARGDLIEFTDDWRRLRRDPETQALMIGGTEFTGVVGHKVFVTLGADYIQHAPGWRHDWRMDLGKAIRWFEGRLRWVEPDLLLRPSPAELRRWLDVPAPFWVVDVETDGVEPLETYLRDIGIATPDVDTAGKSVMPGAPFDRLARSVGISLLGGDGEKRWMTPEDEAETLDILRDFLTDPRRLKVAHNSYFDWQVLGRLGGGRGATKFHHPANGLAPWLPPPKDWLNVGPSFDTLFPTRHRSPEQPKGLKTIGTILTDVGHWETTEAGEAGATTRDDQARLLYNTRGDTVVNARIVKPLVVAATERGYFDEIEEGPRRRRI